MQFNDQSEVLRHCLAERAVGRVSLAVICGALLCSHGLAVTPQFIITTVAGNGNSNYSGSSSDGGPATNAVLSRPAGIALGATGNLLISDSGSVRRVTPSGVISTVAGGGNDYGDGGPALGASLAAPVGLVADGAGNLYIADSLNNLIRKVTPGGTISTVAGRRSGPGPFGDYGYSGDGGPAVMAALARPTALALDRAGNLLIADTGNGRIRRVTKDGLITTVVGGGESSIATGSNDATKIHLSSPTGLAVDSANVMYIADGSAVRKVTPTGLLTTLSLSPTPFPWSLTGVAVDNSGNVYVVDSVSGRVSFIDDNGTQTVVAGNRYAYSGDGGLATKASFGTPNGIAADEKGNLYVSDNEFPSIRRLTPVPPGGAVLTLSNDGLGYANALSFPSAGQQLVYLASTAGSFPVSVSAQTDLSGTWLSAKLSADQVPAVLTVTASAQNLAPGKHTGRLIITASGAFNTPYVIPVEFTPGTLSAFTILPADVSLTYQQGTSHPSQTVAVSSQGAPLSFVATAQSTAPAGTNWLSVSPASGTTPANLTVSLVNTDTLAPGTYSGSVTVSLPDKTGTQTVNVALTVGAAFDVLAPALQFSLSNGASSNQSLLVTNLSPLALDVTATSRNGYVSVSPQKITISAVVGERQSQFVASVTASSLPGGLLHYSDSIIVTAAGQSREFPLSISVLSDDAPQLLLSSTAVTLFTLPGVNNRDQTDIQLLNAGSGPLDFYVSYPAPWITVTPAAPVCLTPPSCQDVRLPAGQVQPLTIFTNDNVGTQSTVTPTKGQDLVVFPTALTVRHGLEADVVNVYLNVPTNLQNLPPRSSAAGVLVGLPGQLTQTVTLRNFNTTPASFTITAPAWLPVTSSSTSIPKGNPGLLDLTIGPPSRTPTQEEIQAGPIVKLTFPGMIVNNAPYVLQIQTVYAGTSQTTQSSQSLSSIHPLAATCTPSQLSAVFASPANQFQVTAGLPVSLVARISDNCGNVPASAAALVTFSSGESPLSLTQWPDGLWRGTWQPQAPQPGPVTLVLSAASETISATTQTLLSGTVTGNALVPVVLSKSVVNAASQEGQNDTISPGEIVTIYGSNLASQTLAAAGSPVASLGSVTVTASGVTLPLFSVSSGQVNAIFPYGFPVGQTVLLVLTRDGVPSVPLPLKVVPARPGIFTQSADGKGAGAIVDTGTADHPAAYIVDAAHPAHSGDNISIYCTGLGPVDPPVDVAQGEAKNQLSFATGSVTVVVGKGSAEVFYAGLAPGFSGLYQVNARVPANAPSGTLSVQISVNNIPSNGVDLVVH